MNPQIVHAVPPPNIAAITGLNELLPKYAYVNLRPGELIITDQPTIVATLLGSCISICLYHPWKKVGGICHCLLPSRPDNSGKKTPHSYVNDTLSYMLHTLEKDYGVSLQELKVKLFGGANMFRAKCSDSKAADGIGCQNIEAARAVIKRNGLQITSERVGGDLGYKLFFNTQTGEVFLRSVSGRLRDESLDDPRNNE